MEKDTLKKRQDDIYELIFNHLDAPQELKDEVYSELAELIRDTILYCLALSKEVMQTAYMNVNTNSYEEDKN